MEIWSRTSMTGWAAVAAAVGALGLAEPAASQTVSLEGGGGVATPTGELADLADPGASLSLSAAYELTPRIMLRAVGTLDLLSGKSVDAPGFPSRTPDIELWSGGAGVEGRLTPADWNWFASVMASGMATSFNTEVFDELVFDPDTQELVGDFAATYFTAGAGLKLGYRVGTRLDVFISGEWRQMLADEEETDVFGQLSPEVEAFDSGSWFPVTAGLRYEISF